MNIEFLAPAALPPLPTSDEDAHMLDSDDPLAKIVTPGEIITSDPQYMRGHGTYVEAASDEKLTITSAVAGVVERVNKLVSVRPLRTRYNPEIGDIVVGRITEVAPKRWKVDVNGRQDGVLLLSSINLPGGVQRRKSESDELQMRTFFAEGDLCVAEVQAFFGDGAVSLHTRSLKYGKLRNGSFVCVPPALVQRCKSHFHSLPCGIEVILGLNGYIWVSKQVATKDEELDPELVYSSKNDKIDLVDRENIARVSNCLLALARKFMYINDTIIVYTYEASLNYPVSDLLKISVIEAITSEASARAAMS
ncbi:uncharacterized protein VTP21DRAFT_6823 [Calcarisporiella thermophila]|uniref:uncharacterized protein n=1 Tax=Calcarisporiella thermophila TaxID=911321 RepID=UPI003742674F